MTIGIPTVETGRLLLRPPNIGDFAGYAAMLSTPRARFMGGPFDERAAWGMFCHDVAQWHLFGHGALTIVLRANAEIIGQVGINHGPLFPEKELGWLLMRAMRAWDMLPKLQPRSAVGPLVHWGCQAWSAI